MMLASGEQMKNIDKRAIGSYGIPSLTLMERAAEAIAAQVQSDLKESDTVAVFAGNGNNGGDGFAAAWLLLQRGYQIRVFFTGDPQRMTPDCREMQARYAALGGCTEPFQPETEEQEDYVQNCAVVIDAIFGVGLSRPISGIAAQAVACINRSNGLVFSADMPSGIHSDTGAALGDAVLADKTMTFTCKKIGQILGAGPRHCGELIVAPIGIPAAALEAESLFAIEVDDSLVSSMLPDRPADGHKGTFGKVCIIAGSLPYAGAPVLSARSASHSGCGLVFLCVPQSIWEPTASRCLEEMVIPFPDAEGMLSESALQQLQEKANGCTAVLLGPGLGRSAGVEQIVQNMIKSCQCPLVLDADGINALSGHIDWLGARNGLVTVLTPHDGEFFRLTGHHPSADRVVEARKVAAQLGCFLLLKGHPTVVATPDGRCYVNTTGGSGLAKGGSGDVLAGLLVSLIAQGMEAGEAAAAAAWIHGRAGDLLEIEQTARAMVPGQLIEKFPAVFCNLTSLAAEKKT